MLASFSEFEGGHGFFLGLSRQEQVIRPEPHANLGVLLGGAGTVFRNCSEEDGRRAADGPTSSGSGHTHALKPQQECQNAQKRFRARQKERMTCLEREVADKKEAFEQLAQENLLLRSRTTILEKVVSCRDEQLNIVQAFQGDCHNTADAHPCFGSGSSNTVANSPNAKESFREMKKEKVIAQYKAFLAEVSRYLLHCQYPCSDPTNPIVQKVTGCVERMGYVLRHLILLNSPLMRQLLLLNLETMQPGAATESHWDSVVASLQLGAEQRSDILAVLDLYFGLLGKVYEERKLIRMALGQGVGTLEPSASSFVARNELATEMELTEQLHVNLAKEHSAHTLLSCFFLGKVLMPPQFAKVAVYSYPFFPDCLAVALAIGRQDHQLRGSGCGTVRGTGQLHGGEAIGNAASGSGSLDSNRQQSR